jgi:molecular chaperone GrpE
MTDGNGGVKDEDVQATGLEPVETDAGSASEIEVLRRERDEFRDQFLRKRADFENFRKRVERDRAQAGLDAVTALMQALIPAFDSLERALATDADEGSLRKGVELIQREIRAILDAQGITVEDPTGKKFDPEIHQALSHETVPGFQEGVVVEAFRKAYFLKGRLLRPALVKVAKGDAPGEDDNREQEPVH